jgi:hypothetical protein
MIGSEAREFYSRFLQIADPPAFLANSPSKVLKTELFEAQTTHQAGCESVKNVAKF